MFFVRWFTFICLVSLLGLPASAQDSAKDKDNSDGASLDFSKGPGIEVGKTLPEIKLSNQDGEEVSVQEMLKAGNVGLVFFRSADW